MSLYPEPITPDAAEPKKRLAIEPHVTEDNLVVWRHRGTSGRLVLCFTGIGAKTEPVPGIEFASIASGGGRDNVLFIIDPHRTWLNGQGLIARILEIVEDFAEEIGVDEYMTLGHSMGGYAAMIMPDYLPVKNAVALSPQFSVHPDVVGDDPRWMYHRVDIKTHRIISVAQHMVAGTSYHVFHGGMEVEHPQRDRFPVAENLNHWVVPEVGHQVPQRMRGMGLLNDVVRASFGNRIKKVRLLLSPLGVHRRELEHYPALAPYAEVSS